MSTPESRLESPSPPADDASERKPSRVLVVDDPHAAADLADASRGQLTIRHCPGLLAALAEIGQGDVAGLICPARCFVDAETASHAALAELAPDLRVLITVDAETPVDQIERLESAGFERFVASGEPAETIAAALGLDDAAEVAEVVEQAPSDDPVLAAPAADSAEAPSRDEPGGPTDDVDELELGDTDLVESLLAMGTLAEGTRCRDLAVRLIEQQSGLSDVRLTPGVTPPADAHASVPVIQRGVQLGTLSCDSPDGTADDLTLWAEWVAPWLTLELQTQRLQHLAMHDELTGVWNRRYFTRFLSTVVQRAAEQRTQVSVMVFDVDDFKTFNDQIGHACGDEILRETARLMQSVVRDHDVVSRIGGDEFAVVFWDKGMARQEGSSHPGDVLKIARRFQKQIVDLKFPRLAQHDMPTLTISAGLATFPWDGSTAEELVEKADQMALESKRKGKNALTLGRDALQAATRSVS